MPNLYYSEPAIAAIKSFIRAYEEAFFELYRDSGLSTESEIINNYRLSAAKISDQIFSAIDHHLSNKKVLGRKEIGKWQELTFYVGSRLITIYYSDQPAKTRVVEMIGVERKPIIF